MALKLNLKKLSLSLAQATAVLGLFALSATAAQAGNTIDVLPRPFALSPGEMSSVYLRERMSLQKIFVQAEGFYCETTVEVFVNGDLKGTMRLPAYDPSYTVTIADSTDSIELRNVGTCAAHIQDVRVVLGNTPAHESSHRHHHPNPSGAQSVLSDEALNQSAAIAAAAIELVDQLRPGSSQADQTTYLLPIKKIAARLYATANARGDSSQKVAGLLRALEDQIDLAATYLDANFERQASFGDSLQLLGLREKIDAILM